MTSRCLSVCFQFQSMFPRQTKPKILKLSEEGDFYRKMWQILHKTQPRQSRITLKLSAAWRRSHYHAAPTNPDHTKTRNFGGWVWVWYTVVTFQKCHSFALGINENKNFINKKPSEKRQNFEDSQIFNPRHHRPGLHSGSILRELSSLTLFSKRTSTNYAGVT